MDPNRRKLLSAAVLAAASVRIAPSLAATDKKASYPIGAGTLSSLSDGYLDLPLRFPDDDPTLAEEMKQLLTDAGLSTEQNQPPCNISLWQDPSNDKLVLFDIGAGTQFMDSAGQLAEQLEARGIDPADVTDVLFTHAHPDHCWGLLDDFDELFCPEATYHIHQTEFDYWLSDDTLNQTPESSLAMVAGARNRLPLIREQLKFFNWGDEVLPGIEAVDTHGHTPGHTSFAVHSGNESLLVLGDALTHPVFSFQRPQWHRATDIDPETAAQQRGKLLDRLVADSTLILGFHLPDAGFGRVEKAADQYQLISQTM